MVVTFTPTWLAVWTVVSLVIGSYLTVKTQRFIRRKTA